MKVILLQDVDKLGVAGELVDAKPGYARNFLFPQKLAIPGTEENLETWKEQKAQEEAEEQARVENAQALKEKLEAIEVKLQMKAGQTGRLFGAVTAADIANEIQNLTEERIDRKKIDLSANIRELGSYTVPVRLYPEVVAEVKVEVEER